MSWGTIYLTSARIRDMAKYINVLEHQMEQQREGYELSQFTETRGAYFAALKMAEMAGVKNEVHKVREELKESNGFSTTATTSP